MLVEMGLRGHGVVRDGFLGGNLLTGRVIWRLRSS